MSMCLVPTRPTATLSASCLVAQAEIDKVKKDIEENNIQNEVTILGLMKKQQEAVCELSE